MQVKHLLSLGLVALGVAACGSTPTRVETPPPMDDRTGQRLARVEQEQAVLASQQQRQDATIAALSAQAQRHDCLIRYDLVNSSCIALNAGDAGGVNLMTKIAACVKNKGFPQGAATCVP